MNILLLLACCGLATAAGAADSIPKTGTDGEIEFRTITNAVAENAKVAIHANASNQSIDNLLNKVYTGPRALDRPDVCRPVAGAPQVHICTLQSHSPRIKISNLDFAPYPVKSGLLQFSVLYKLLDTIKVGAKMHIDAFRDDEEIYSGIVDFCPHAALAEQPCPIKSSMDGFETVKRTIFIPDETPPGTYAYVVKLESPKKVELLRFAAILDVRTDLKSPLKYLGAKEQDIKYAKHEL